MSCATLLGVKSRNKARERVPRSSPFHCSSCGVASTVSTGAEVHGPGAQCSCPGRVTSAWQRQGSPTHTQPRVVKPGRA